MMNPLCEGDRVLLDGKPGIVGAGWASGSVFVMDIKMDTGETRCVPSGTYRIQKTGD